MEAGMEWHALYQAAHHPDVLLLPADDDEPNFGRGIATSRQSALCLSCPLIAKLFEESIIALGGSEKNIKSVDGFEGAERSIDQGKHPGTTCREKGTSPIVGWRFEYCGDDVHDLSAEAYDALDAAARAKYTRRAPRCYPPLDEPTDEDDGQLALTLPGTRRAIAILLQRDVEVQLENMHDFDDEGAHMKILNSHDQRMLLAEYLEMCWALQLDEHARAGTCALECQMEEPDEFEPETAMRLFCAIVKRYPKHGPNYHRDRDFFRGCLPDLLSRAADPSDEDDTDEDTSSKLGPLLRRVRSLSLATLCEVLYILPTDQLVDGPLLQASTRFDELIIGATLDEVKRGDTTCRTVLKVASDSGGLEIKEAVDLCLSTYSDANLLCAVEIPGFVDEARFSFAGYELTAKLSNTEDPQQRMVTMSEAAAAVDMCPKYTDLLDPYPSDDCKKTYLQKIVAQCSLQVSVQRRQSLARLAVLREWAAANTTSSSPAAAACVKPAGKPDVERDAKPEQVKPEASVLELLNFYTRRLAELEGSNPEATASMLKLLLDESLLPHAVAQPASLRSIVRDGAATLDVAMLRQLLAARPLPPKQEEGAQEMDVSEADGEDLEAAAEGGASRVDVEAEPAVTAGPAVAAVEAPVEAVQDYSPASTHPPSPAAQDEAETEVAECSAVEEEEALLEALAPWAAAHSASEVAKITPLLRVDLLPLGLLASHVYTRGKLFSGALDVEGADGRALCSALADALLPGVRALRCCSLEDDPPPDISCCITLNVMRDPVIAADGKSYEREAIEKYWQKAGSPISPITRQKLPDRTLVPNVNLRSICAEYLAQSQRVKAAATSPEQVTMAALHAAHLAEEARRVCDKLGKRARDEDGGGGDTSKENGDQGQRKACRPSCPLAPQAVAEQPGGPCLVM